MGSQREGCGEMAQEGEEPVPESTADTEGHPQGETCRAWGTHQGNIPITHPHQPHPCVGWGCSSPLQPIPVNKRGLQLGEQLSGQQGSRKYKRVPAASTPPWEVSRLTCTIICHPTAKAVLGKEWIYRRILRRISNLKKRSHKRRDRGTG